MRLIKSSTKFLTASCKNYTEAAPNYLMSRLFILFIRAYQVTLSPYFGRQCRFTPTCSHYSIDAFNRYGTLKGIHLTMTRLSKCHPWHAGGHDPIP